MDDHGRNTTPLVPLGAMDQIAHGVDHAKGTVLAAPTNVAFTGPNRDMILVPNIGRWHVTRFRAPGLRGVSLFMPDPAVLGD